MEVNDIIGESIEGSKNYQELIKRLVKPFGRYGALTFYNSGGTMCGRDALEQYQIRFQLFMEIDNFIVRMHIAHIELTKRSLRQRKSVI